MRDKDRPPVLAHLRFVADRPAFSGLGLRDRFTRIYTTNLWGAEDSRSGLGSGGRETDRLISRLPRLLKDLGVRSLVDAPCGDARWINQTVLGVDYTGVDIVPELVSDLASRAALGIVQGRYLAADITTDVLPTADAVLCRDCLVHLSFEHVARVIENFRRADFTFIIATTFPQLQSNTDCEDGDWRALNMTRAPFRWPPPVMLLNEGCEEGGGAYRDKSLGVWRTTDIPSMRAGSSA